ncbi:MAG: hypothetical protein ONB12_12450 [candidate division KSB1 bacterium]|nr:hypothetical protein [candidate division KSB1 bacterium]
MKLTPIILRYFLPLQGGGETRTEPFQAALSEDVLHTILFFNRREGYAVSSAGLVLHTQDTGATRKRENTVPLNCS